MLIHPILAAAFVFWLVRQYGWRKKGMALRGDEREEALARHQRHGEVFLLAGISRHCCLSSESSFRIPHKRRLDL